MRVAAWLGKVAISTGLQGEAGKEKHQPLCGANGNGPSFLNKELRGSLFNFLPGHSEGDEKEKRLKDRQAQQSDEGGQTVKQALR